MQIQGNEGTKSNIQWFFLLREEVTLVIILTMKEILERSIRKRSFLLMLLLLPLIWIIFDLLFDPIQANPLQELLISTGETSVRLLVGLLWISPLRRVFPGSRIFQALQSQKRVLGLGVFSYVLIHFLIYLVESLVFYIL